MADTTIGRLQASLAAATNEVTVAAAKINFDFCLIKFEPPAEYAGLGSLLSPKRKHEAESGTSHVTARRLASLFEGTCPKTPKLIAAYGERASEISKVATTDTSKGFFDSVFAAYAGVDATSIWAAATSSESPNGAAIQIHLLACLLASIWDPPEAISIWVQLIEERRNKIAADLANGISLPFSAATAATQQEIPRDQLAEWDSSARAWIQTAEEVRAKDHTQIKIILKNISLNIDKHSTFYASVMETWRTALQVVENLISGIPQEDSDGIALLSISAWNLYPDILVCGEKNIEISMNDPLISPGGILTCWSVSASGVKPSKGISWSLSLAHMRYYGHKVPKTGVLSEDPSNLSWTEFEQVVLGCVLRLWQVSHAEQHTAMKTLKLLLDESAPILETLESKPKLRHKITLPLKFLQRSVDNYWLDQEMGDRLLDLGRKRFSFFPQNTRLLPQSDVPLPFFGLMDGPRFLSTLLDAEQRLACLRRVCQRHLDSTIPAMIRYHWDEEKQEGTYATATPIRLKNDQGECVHGHCRWFPSMKAANAYSCSRAESEREKIVIYGEEQFDRQNLAAFRGLGIDSGRSSWVSMFGKDETAAVFMLENKVEDNNSYHGMRITYADVAWAVEQGALDLEGYLRRCHDGVLERLLPFAQAAQVFEHIHGNVISHRILHMNVGGAMWIDIIEKLLHYEKTVDKYELSIPERLSILSYFVAGCDIRAGEIPLNVLGMSAGSSLFVINKVLQDPWESYNQTPHLVRILGNIGRPGCVIFSSVTNPIVPPLDGSLWRVANQHRFNGRKEDTLSATSMHLCFTDWTRPITGILDQGNRDSMYSKMEAVVSIRDRGNWIGDVDISTALSRDVYFKMLQLPPCTHPKDQAPSYPVVSIECWDELRDPPAGKVVVRAHGNWVARLAAAAYLAQCAGEASSSIQRITICPPSVCWTCIEHSFSEDVLIY